MCVGGGCVWVVVVGQGTAPIVPPHMHMPPLSPPHPPRARAQDAGLPSRPARRGVGAGGRAVRPGRHTFRRRVSRVRGVAATSSARPPHDRGPRGTASLDAASWGRSGLLAARLRPPPPLALRAPKMSQKLSGHPRSFAPPTRWHQLIESAHTSPSPRCARSRPRSRPLRQLPRAEGDRTAAPARWPPTPRSPQCPGARQPR